MLCPIEATHHFYKHLSCTLPVSEVVVCVVLANSGSLLSLGAQGVQMQLLVMCQMLVAEVLL